MSGAERDPAAPTGHGPADRSNHMTIFVDAGGSREDTPEVLMDPFLSAFIQNFG